MHTIKTQSYALMKLTKATGCTEIENIILEKNKKLYLYTMQPQELIQNRFSGAINNEAEYIELLINVFGVLILGLVMWRLMVVFHKKKNAKRKRSSYFENSIFKR